MSGETPVQEVLPSTATTRQRLFPVVGPHGELIGAFHQDDLVGVLQDPRASRVLVRDIVVQQPVSVRCADTIATAHRLLRVHHVEEILVVDDAHGNRPLGILTSADILQSFTRAISRKTNVQAEDQATQVLTEADLEPAETEEVVAPETGDFTGNPPPTDPNPGAPAPPRGAPR